MDNRTRRLAYLGLLTALGVVLTRFASVRLTFAGVENIRFGFGHLPIILAGVLYGPLAGAAVGAATDVLGFFLSPMGAYMPHFTVIAALTGALPPLFLAVFGPRPAGTPSFVQLLVSVALTQILCAVLLTPYCLKLLFGMPWAVTVPPRVIAQAFLIPIYASLMHLIFRSVSGLVPVRGKSEASPL